MADKKVETEPKSECSVCNQPDVRTCGCPWDKPFNEWPHDVKRRLLYYANFKPQHDP